MYIRMHVKIYIFICLFVCLFYHVKTENSLEKFLGVRVKRIENIHCGSGSSISNCSVYQTEHNKLIYVKENSNFEYAKVFKGEFEGLKAIRSIKTVLAPKPVATGCLNNGHHFIAMEYLNMTALSFNGSTKFGSLLADMHMHNLKDEQQTQFGFHIDTYYGFIPQNNTWMKKWVKFFIENRMEFQIRLLRISSKLGLDDKTIIVDFWSQLKPIIPKFFEGIDVKPSLLHGDLWRGNVGETKTNSKPVIFDPASFYGHHEYDIASTSFLGGYPEQFYDAYFDKIPKAKGYENRETLYHLFHYLITWNSYDGVSLIPTINAFNKLLNVYK